jgi:hypothetical protein
VNGNSTPSVRRMRVPTKQARLFRPAAQRLALDWYRNVAVNSPESEQIDIDDLLGLSLSHSPGLGALSLGVFRLFLDEARASGSELYLELHVPLGEFVVWPTEYVTAEEFLESAVYPRSLLGVTVPGFCLSAVDLRERVGEPGAVRCLLETRDFERYDVQACLYRWAECGETFTVLRMATGRPWALA